MATTAGELHEIQRRATRVERVVRPTTWPEALEALIEHPDARPVAGGTDLVLELARSSSPPVTLVDLSAITTADEITETDGALVLGGGVTHNQVVRDPRFRGLARPLAQACLEIGSPQLRNRATIAGNLATASPANDTISALMALDATVVLSHLAAGSVRERQVPVREFFTGFRATVRRPEELITEIHVPTLDVDDGVTSGVWAKLGLRRFQAISVVHLGLVLGVDGAGVIDRADLALGSIAPTVVMSEVFRDAVVGGRVPIEPTRVAAIADAVAASIEPIDDVRATAAYRRAVTATLVPRGCRC
ncbi:MAG: FAD binding domain-containing protein [Acidimicrobiales bacterium]